MAFDPITAGIELIGDLSKAATPIINHYFPDPTIAAEAQAKLDEAQATVVKAQADANAAEYAAMSAVAVADSQSESWATRIQRPVSVFWAMGLITILLVLAIFNPALATQAMNVFEQVPGPLWAILGGGLGLFPMLDTMKHIATSKK